MEQHVCVRVCTYGYAEKNNYKLQLNKLRRNEQDLRSNSSFINPRLRSRSFLKSGSVYLCPCHFYMLVEWWWKGEWKCPGSKIWQICVGMAIYQNHRYAFVGFLDQTYGSCYRKKFPHIQWYQTQASVQPKGPRIQDGSRQQLSFL